MPVVSRTVRGVARALTPAQAAGSSWGDSSSGLMSMFTKAGQWVDRDKALTLGAFYAGVGYIADIVAVLPLHVMNRKQDGTREQLRSPSESFVWGRPNRDVTRFVFWHTVGMQYTIHGNAYLYAPPAQPGQDRQMWPIDPIRVRVLRDAKGEKAFEIDGTIEERPLLAGGSIVHIMGPSVNGLVGMSLLEQMAQAIGLGLSSDEYAQRFFGEGTQVGGYLQTDAQLSAQQVSETLKGWDKDHKGPAKFHKTGLLTRGIKWMTTSLKPSDAQLIETRKFNRSEFALFLRLPEFLMGSHDKESSWGSGLFEILRAMFTFRIDPLLVNFEQSISDELLARPSGHYARFERKAFLRMDPKSQAEYLQIKRRNGVLSADEWRELDDEEPVGGEWGGRMILEGNMVALNADGTVTPLSAGGQAPPAPEQSPAP